MNVHLIKIYICEVKFVVKLSLGKKMVLSIILIAVLLSGTCIGVSTVVFRSIMDREYLITADSMAATVASTIDGDRVQRITEKVMELYNVSENKLTNEQWEDPNFEAYVAQYQFLTEDEDYTVIREQLRRIQDVSEIDCAYTVYGNPEDMTMIYIVDGAYEDIVPIGSFDWAEKEYYPYLNSPEQGIPAVITTTPEYGFLVTSCAPIRNSKGEIVCFAAVDLSMNDVLAKENQFIFLLTAILLFLVIIICTVSIICVQRKIVTPINMLSEAAGQYGQKQFKEHQHGFRTLDIHTGDELEILLHSMVQMEQDIDSYIKSLTQTKEQLYSARQQADNMHELAHMDSMTGIRNRLAYDKEIVRIDNEIKEGTPSFGIAMIDLNFLKHINDTYGHEHGNEAIISLSKLICDIFKHSPVFRIGGDEFVVILKNADFERIETLCSEFNQRLEQFATDTSLQPWERISAAFGYALFDSKADHCAEDVFKRADQKMYERKKAMKAVRK